MRRLATIRGQLVLWYLGVLAVLLVGLGVFQVITLTNYLRSSTAASMRRGAHAELSVLNPCFVQDAASLRKNAQTLARLLGSHDTAVAIVDRQGAMLAGHGIGQPGLYDSFHIPPGTLHQLIGSTTGRPPPALSVGDCPRPYAFHGPPFGFRRLTPPLIHPAVTTGNLLLVAVPLGSGGQVVGYAILGRSMLDAQATVTRTLLVFAAGALVALLIAALVALPIINRALRPLRRVSTVAEAIAQGDLQRRSHISETGDEIGRLGEAFDAMVDQLQRALQETEESEERMRAFLADASHELRTPVTVLRGASQVLLMQGAAGNDLTPMLKDIHEEAVRLSRLVDDLLTLSRIDAGQQLSPQPVQLREYLLEFLERYGSVWPARQIDLLLPPTEEAAVLVDPEVLRRILTNLVDNAARYSRPGGMIWITVTLAGESAVLSVEDEGPGMTAEDAAHVFDRFYRSNKSRSRESGGTGLGLSIVRGLVESSNGTISLDTAPDRGTVVSITLPLVDVPAQTRMPVTASLR